MAERRADALASRADEWYARRKFERASGLYMRAANLLKDVHEHHSAVHDHCLSRVLAISNGFRDAKQKGAEAVRRRDYREAAQHYTAAHEYLPGDAATLANRSLCHLRINEPAAALADAQAAVKRDAKFAKARYREGCAATALGQHALAVAAFEEGVRLQPGNAELERALADARTFQVGAAVDMDSVVSECRLFNPPNTPAYSEDLQQHIMQYLTSHGEFARSFFQLMLPSARRQTAQRVDTLDFEAKKAMMDDCFEKYSVIKRRAARAHTRVRLDVTPAEAREFEHLLSHADVPSRAALSAILDQRFPDAVAWEPRKLDVTGGDVQNRRDRAEWQHLDPWYRFCYHAVAAGRLQGQVCEVLTREFVQSLARYLHGRAKLYTCANDARPVLLEVGAGDGRLCGLLTQELRQLAAEDAARLAPPLALTDGGFESALLSLGPTLEPEPDADDAPIWDLRCSDMLPGFHSPLERGTHPDVEVEMLEQSAAVAKFAPTLVLCSWMPGGEDWTATWRSAPSVKEYVLLGVPDTGVCGNEYRTWGVGRGDASVNLSPAEMDGFERVDVHAVSRWQLCCVDRPSFEEVGHSRCVSFRRTASGFEVV